MKIYLQTLTHVGKHETVQWVYIYICECFDSYRKQEIGWIKWIRSGNF